MSGAPALPAEDLRGRPVPGGIPRRGAGRSSALDAWSAAVGPVVFGASPASPPSAPPPAESVRLLSWNLRVGAADLRGRVSEFEAAGDPFVILLQEAVRTGGRIPPHPPEGSRFAGRILDPLPPGRERDEIVAVAREAGLALLYSPSMRNGGPGDPPEDRGNAILSSLPLREPEVVELPVERQRRAAVGAMVDLQGPDGTTLPLHLLSVHLENRAPWRRFWRIPGAARAAQARALLAAAAPAPGRAGVLGGDLNSWWGERREPAVRLLRAAYPHPRTLPGLPTHHWELGLDRQSDYLLFRLPEGWGGEYRRLDDEGGSDHWPLEGRIHPVKDGPG